MMPKPLEHRLVFLRRDPLLLDAAAHRHQEEDRPHGDPLARPAVRRWRRPDATLRRVIVVLTCTGISSVRAKSSICIVRSKLPSKPRKASCVAASAPSRLMPSRRTPACAHALERLERGQRRGRGRQRRLQSGRDGVADQLEQVGPLQRIAAGHHQHRPARKAGDLIEQGLRLVGRKLVRVRLLLGRRPAMLAHQIAGQRDLVVEHQRADAEVARRVVGMVCDVSCVRYCRCSY